MSREAHVQFWEGLAVRLRWATRLSTRLRLDRGHPDGPDPVLHVLQQPETAFGTGRQDPGLRSTSKHSGKPLNPQGPTYLWGETV